METPAPTPVELIKNIVQKYKRISIGELWMDCFLLCREKRDFPALDTQALRELLQLHEDVFVLSDDSVSLKASDKKQKLTTMASVKKESSVSNGTALDLATILKRNISKKEAEVVEILIKLINEKPKMTMSMLAANMSSLSQDHHAIIGHGQKALVKYLKKYPEVFCLINDSISVSSVVKQQLDDSDWHSSITEDSLRQVLCTVTKVGPTFGFLTNETLESTVYFTSYVFEGGKTQDLTKQLKVGDVVLVDAEKGDPNSTAEWRAKKVVKLKRQGDTFRRERGASWDQMSLPSVSECSELEWETSDNLSVASSNNASSHDVGRHQEEIVDFLKARILSRSGKISVQNLTGHLSALPAHLRKSIGCKLEDLRTFLQLHGEHFVLDSENVTVRQARAETPAVDRPLLEQAARSSTPLKKYTGETATIFSIEANGNGVLKLPNGILAFFDAEVVLSSKIALKKGMMVTCDAVEYPDRWEITKIWHSSVHELNSDDFPIRGHESTVVRVFCDYGFIAYGECTEDNIYFSKSVVEGPKDLQDLMVSLPMGSKVICDAVTTGFYSSKYRAIRVIPLIDDDAWSSSHKRHRAMPSLNHTEDVYVSDDESGRMDLAEGKLYSCTGRVMNVYGTHGFIQRGAAAGKDPENVYFNSQSFLAENKKPVRVLTDAVQVGDLVTCDAELAGENVSCRWRATAVWKYDKKPTVDVELNDEALSDQRGTIIKVYPSKGIISFGPHIFLHRVFFSIETFYFYSCHVANLMDVLKIGHPINFDALIDEGEVRMKWKATKVWVGSKPGLQEDAMKNTLPLKGKRGTVSVLNDMTGLINYGSSLYHVYFTKDAFHNGDQVLENLKWVLKLGDEVFFDAKFDRLNLRYTADLVWRGNRPRLATDTNSFLGNAVGNENHVLSKNALFCLDVNKKSHSTALGRFPRTVNGLTLPSQSPSLNELEDISIDDDDNITIPDFSQTGIDPCNDLALMCSNGSGSDGGASQPDLNVAGHREQIQDGDMPTLATDDNDSSSIKPKTEFNDDYGDLTKKTVLQFPAEALPQPSYANHNAVTTVSSLDSNKAEKPTRSSSLTQLALQRTRSNGQNSKSLDDLSLCVGIKPRTETFKKCIGAEMKQSKKQTKVLVPWCDDTPKEKWISLTDDDSCTLNKDDYLGSYPSANDPTGLFPHDASSRKLGFLDWQARSSPTEENQNAVLETKSIWDTDDVLSADLAPHLKDGKENSYVSSSLGSGINLPIDVALWSRPSQANKDSSGLAISLEFEKAWSVCFENLRRVCDASKMMLRSTGDAGSMDVDKIYSTLNGLASLDFKPLQLGSLSTSAFVPADEPSTSVATQTLSTGEVLSQHIYSGD